jgi:thymidylate synthase ThyX
MNVKVIARTVEDINSTGEDIKKDALIISGKAAGICYMPDNYLSEGMQNETKATTRAKFNAKSGHYSVYEHMHVSFILEIPKILAMILNSTRLYNTSEKSARYTMMHPDTDLENTMYQKWIGIFTDRLKNKYEGYISDKEIEKLAIENARYLISVFTMTTMEFTVPYSRAILLCEWLDKFASNLFKLYTTLITGASPIQYNRLSKNFELIGKIVPACNALASKIREAIGITKEDPILVDHKNMGIELFADVFALGKDEEGFSDLFQQNHSSIRLMTKKNYYGDVYVDTYTASFAELAQAQRHRTINYSVQSFIDMPSINCYIPNLIKNDSILNEEWKNDFESLIDNGILPQGTLLTITEEGRFEDFILKCKERCCCRAQEEIRHITTKQLLRYKYYNENTYENFMSILSDVNRHILNNIIFKNYKKDNYITRCMFGDYICKEPCPFLVIDRKYNKH